MPVKSIAELSNSAIFTTFIKLSFSIKTFVLSFFKWPFKTGFTVLNIYIKVHVPCEIRCLFSDWKNGQFLQENKRTVLS